MLAADTEFEIIASREAALDGLALRASHEIALVVELRRGGGGGGADTTVVTTLV